MNLYSASRDLIVESMEPTEQQNDICQKCDDLLPAVEKAAMMFHMCYLYLSGYPELEQMIRERALNARLLFISTETVMFKSVCISDNLVKTLFPIIKVAVERSKPEMAKTYLHKAEGWIAEIITTAEEMVTKYQDENKTLDKTTSQIYGKSQEKKSTDAKIIGFEKDLEQLEQQLNWNAEKQITKKIEIDEIQSRIIQEIDAMSERNSGQADVMSRLGFFSNLLYKNLLANTGKAIFKTLKILMDKHASEMAELKKEEAQLGNKMMKKRMELMRLQIEKGTIPSPRHLEKVKQSLCSIQTVLLDMLSFWKHVGVLLKKLKDETFARNQLADLEAFKDVFLQGVAHVQQDWVTFGQSCRRAQKMFEVQNRDAYKFLEMTPSSLSADDWQTECTRLEERLDQIYVTPEADNTE